MKFFGKYLEQFGKKRTILYPTNSVPLHPPPSNSALKYQSTYLLQGFDCVLNRSSRTHLTRLHSNTQIVTPISDRARKRVCVCVCVYSLPNNRYYITNERRKHDVRACVCSTYV